MGERLKRAREYLNLTQEQVANILNVDRDAIVRIEKGERKVTTDELVNISELYCIEINDLLNKENNIYNNNQLFIRNLEKLSDKDKKEIINLIKLKNEIIAERK